MRKPEKGLFIVFEGVDGAGKTMQVTRAAEWIMAKGYHVVVLREPTDGVWGKKIRSIASGLEPPVSADMEVDLFIKDRRDNITSNILPALRQGSIVLQDRYYYSSLAYQGARGLDVNQIKKQHAPFVIQPDFLLLFDIDPKKGLERIAQIRKSKLTIFEQIDYLQKVKSIYDSLCEPYIVRINAEESPDIVQHNVQKAIATVLPDYYRPPYVD